MQNSSNKLRPRAYTLLEDTWHKEKEHCDDTFGSEGGRSANLSALFYRAENSMDASTQRNSGQASRMFLPQLPQGLGNISPQGFLDRIVKSVQIRCGNEAE